MHFNRGATMLTMICLLFLATIRSPAQDGFNIYLVGDAGDHEETGGTLTNLQNELILHPNSAVIFLGDNSYKDILGGIIPFGYKGFDSTRNTIDKIRSQLDVLNHYRGSVYFTPGNHDWWNRTTYQKGRPKLAMEESFIEKNLKLNTSIANPDKVFLPGKGSYGPEYVELDQQSIRLIFIDTYRIIQTGIKKNKISPEEKTFYDRLDSVIREGYILKEKIIVVAHHPVYSVGPYTRHLKHPYLFGRIKASYASFPSYQAMSGKIIDVLRHYPGIYYASGHLHALQYFYTKDSVHYIISGAGSKEKILSVKNIHKYDGLLSPKDYLLWNSGGFFEIDFNKQTTNMILHYDNGSMKCSISVN
jgi:hypothetical protein